MDIHPTVCLEHPVLWLTTLFLRQQRCCSWWNYSVTIQTGQSCPVPPIAGTLFACALSGGFSRCLVVLLTQAKYPPIRKDTITYAISSVVELLDAK